MARPPKYNYGIVFTNKPPEILFDLQEIKKYFTSHYLVNFFDIIHYLSFGYFKMLEN